MVALVEGCQPNGRPKLMVDSAADAKGPERDDGRHEQGGKNRRMSTATLSRATFRTSRLLDFCSEKELTAQTGHARGDWPLVAIKELMDNALGGCEEARIPPEIKVTVNGDGITIADNGPGIPASTIDGILDFGVRVSSREAYVSPTRGAQRNALKTIVAMPFVLDGARGRVDIAAGGQRNQITFGVDQIRQQPTVGRETAPDDSVKNGTSVTVYWPDSAWLPVDRREGPILTVRV